MSGTNPYQTELERWQAAGLLEPEAAGRIAEFERARQKEAALGRPARAIALLGALTLVSGFGSIVAYNWDAIGSLAKLTGMGVLLAAAVVFAIRARERGGVLFEVAALLLSGASLASLALVSQVYHQDGALWQLLAVWLVLAVPTLALTKSRFATVYLYGAVGITLLSALEDLDELLDHTLFPRDSELATGLLVYSASLATAGTFMMARSTARRGFGGWLTHLHLVALGAVGTASLLADGQPTLALLPFVFLPPLVVFLQIQSTGAKELDLGPPAVSLGLFAFASALTVVPLAAFRVESGVLAFFSFMAFFAAYFWAAHQAENDKAVRLAVAMLGGRVVIASFELFENLLVTGLVLMGLGAAALVATRKRLTGGVK